LESSESLSQLLIGMMRSKSRLHGRIENSMKVVVQHFTASTNATGEVE